MEYETLRVFVCAYIYVYVCSYIYIYIRTHFDIKNRCKYKEEKEKNKNCLLKAKNH